MEIDKLISLAQHYMTTNNLDYAETFLKKAISIDENNSIANEIIGQIYFHKNRFNEAIHHLKKACNESCCPNQSFYLLGSSLLQTGQTKEAISYFELLIKNNVRSFEVLHDLGTCYAHCGDYINAASLYEECLVLNNKSAYLYYNIGRVNDELKNFLKAINYYNKAIELDPEFSFAYANIGANFSYLKNYSEAIFFYEKAISINPKIEWIYGDLIFAKKMVGNFSYDLNESNLKKSVIEKCIAPFPLLSMTDDPELQKFCSEQYSKNEQSVSLLNQIRNNHNKKIHVAFFSPDFCKHPVSYLTCDFFECLNKDKFEIYAFSLFKQNENDEMLSRQKNIFYDFIDVENFTDFQIFNLCKDLKIDIAFDLAGYTQNSRPLIFQNKIAQIQINWLGYPGKLGSKSFDYIIADKFVIPELNKKFFTEDVSYLPNSYLIDDRKRGACLSKVCRSDFDLPDNKIILCCFHNAYKFNNSILMVWIEILKRSNNSVLWLAENNSFFKENIIRFFQNNGINLDRVIFGNKVNSIDTHLSRLSLADIYLDSFPYGAHSTALDAIKAGLPIITLCGRSFASRVSGSLLNYLDLSDLICYDRNDYIELVLSLLNDPEKINSYKEKLKINVENSQLFNTPLFASHMESLLSEMYQNNMV